MGRAVDDIDPAAMIALLDYHYPGNIRELENIIERGVVLARENLLTMASLPATLSEHAVHIVREKAGRRLPTLVEREADYIRYVLASCGDNRTRTAKILGIDRVSLWRKLKRYGIDEEHADSDYLHSGNKS